MSSQALALSQWLPNVETFTPNPGDAVQVRSVPISAPPLTQFAPMGGGTGGGGAALPRATSQGQVVMSGVGPLFSLEMGDLDGGRY